MGKRTREEELKLQGYESSKKAIRYAERRQFVEAMAENKRCLQLKIQSGDQRGIAFCYARMSGVCLAMYDEEKSKPNAIIDLLFKYANEAYLTAKQALENDSRNVHQVNGLVIAAHKLGLHYSSEKQYIEAEKYLLESNACNMNSNAEPRIENIWVYSCRILAFINAERAWNQPNSAERLAHFAKADQYIKKAEKFKRIPGRRPFLAIVSKISHDYALCLQDNQQEQAAIEILYRNVAINEELGDTARKIINLDKIASIYFRDGKYRQAEEIFKQVIQLKNIEKEFKYDHSRHILAEIYQQLAAEYNKAENYEQAIQYLEKTLALSELNLDRRKVGEAYIRLGFVYLHKQSFQESARYFHEGYEKYCQYISDREGTNFMELIDSHAQERFQQAEQDYYASQFKTATQLYVTICDEIFEVSKRLKLNNLSYNNINEKLIPEDNIILEEKISFSEMIPAVSEFKTMPANISVINIPPSNANQDKGLRV